MPTTNPVPSQDPSDLLFNAGKLDEVVSGTSQYYTDRLGVNRRTVEGINASADVVLAGLGYAPPVTYASGISLTLTTQTIEYAGEIYAPKVASLPFTTSTWATDSAKFRLIQGVAATDLAAPGGSSMIGYTPAGTGAVATTVQDKLREGVSVLNFGAKGDWNGTTGTDDSDAFEAALNASTSMNDIFVPPGKTYRITRTLNIVGNKTLRGQDAGSQNFQPAYIYHDPASTGPLFNVRSASNGVCIKNLTVTGGNGSFCVVSSNSYVRYEYIKMAGYNGSGIQLLSSETGSSSSKLINCSWTGPSYATSYTGFEIIVNGGDVWLQGCTAIYGAIGINVVQGQAVIIDGCSVNKQSRYAGHSNAPQLSTCGIRLSGMTYKQAISIKNSYIEACDNGIYVDACESLSIEDNLLYDSGVAGVVGAWTAYGNTSINLTSSNCKNVTIKNNNITALSNGDSGHTFYALALNNAENIIVMNNHITTTGNYNAQIYATTPTGAYVLANKRAQSGSQPQPDYDPNSSLIKLDPKLPTWLAVTALENSWVAGSVNPAYNKDNSGTVYLRGMVTSGTVGAHFFTLPVGYRPSVQESFVVNAGGAVGIITVFTDGRVNINSGSNAYVYLSGIQFQAA